MTKSTNFSTDSREDICHRFQAICHFVQQQNSACEFLHSLLLHDGLWTKKQFIWYPHKWFMSVKLWQNFFGNSRTRSRRRSVLKSFERKLLASISPCGGSLKNVLYCGSLLSCGKSTNDFGNWQGWQPFKSFFLLNSLNVKKEFSHEQVYSLNKKRCWLCWGREHSRK